MSRNVPQQIIIPSKFLGAYVALESVFSLVVEDVLPQQNFAC